MNRREQEQQEFTLSIGSCLGNMCMDCLIADCSVIFFITAFGQHTHWQVGVTANYDNTTNVSTARYDHADIG